MGYNEYELQASALLKNNKLSISDIPENNRTEWICAIAVRYQEGAFKFVPTRCRDDIFWKEVLFHNGSTELCQEAVSQNVKYFDFVPDEKRL